MEILLAKNAGFCFGVRRAVETAKSAVKEKRSKDPGAVVYTYGELIHNRTVVEELRKEGIVPIDSLESIKEGDSVVIRSHGVGERVYDILRARGANVSEKNIYKLNVNILNDFIELCNYFEITEVDGKTPEEYLNS